MRILLIHKDFLEENDPGGSRFNEMTKVWSSMGHEITVLAGMVHYNGKEKGAEYKGKYFVNKRQGKVNVWRCHVSESYNKNFVGRFWGYLTFMFYAMWAGLFKTKRKFDIILVTSPPLFVGITGYVLSRVKRIPYIFEIRDLWLESAIDTGVLTNKLFIKLSFKMEAFILKKAVLINVLTPAFREELINKKKIHPDKIIFIPNGADFSLSDELLATFDSAAFRKLHGWENRFVITYVGAHGVANALDQLLDAAEKLRDTNVLFLLIGNGMTRDELIESAQKRNITNIEFLPGVSKQEVFKYILASDLGASVLKRTEAFKTVYSNKTFDYMACKKPILMAIDGVSRKLVEEADAGAYVEPENAEAYNTVVRSYLKNKQLIIDQGENGYRYAKTKFDRTVLAESYLEKIIAITAKKKKSLK